MPDDQPTHSELLGRILERSSNAVYAKDLEGRYLMITLAGAELFGRSVGDFIGHADAVIFEPACAQRLERRDREVISTGKQHIGEEVYDVRGVETSLMTTTTTWYGPGGAPCGLIGTVYDSAARDLVKMSMDERGLRLRSLAAKIVIAEERLRQKLAVELHSGLEQELALARLHLAALRERASVDLREPLAQVTSLIAQAESSLRAASVKLAPPTLHDLGLFSALEWLVEEMRERHALEVQFENHASLDIASKPLRAILFRAIQELLVNAAQHSGVKTALVRLEDAVEALSITISDTGIGFDPAIIETHGYGLFGIREQLEYFGGSLRIESAPGGGTKTALMAPVQRAELCTV